jgi:hypothetical protein
MERVVSVNRARFCATTHSFTCTTGAGSKTRAREFLYGTWALRRLGSTARVGAPRVLDRRNHTSLFRGGPVNSQDGQGYLRLLG